MSCVNSQFFGLLLQFFYLMGVGAETTHSLSHRSLCDPKRSSRRGRPSHKGKKVYKVSRVFQKAPHCSSLPR